MRRLRASIALSAAVLATALIAPAVGALEEGSNTGTTGDYTVQDFNGSPGVKCKYENNPGTQNDELNRIKIKPVFTHGPFAQKTWVGFRFLIKRNTVPFGDDDFRTVFRSRIQKARANDAEVAFFRGGWVAPENAKARYRVHIQFYYYAKGSQTQVIGRVQGLEELYRHILNASTTYDLGAEGASEYCQRNYHGL